MIISVDIETRGLDATQLIIGALQKEGKSKTEYYYNKTDLWNRIKELAQKEQKRGKILNVYSHNASYDFYGYAPLNDPNIKWFCHKPFIVAYTQPTTDQKTGRTYKKEIIKFLDTYSLFRMSLQKLGETIQLPKNETPEELLNENTKITHQLIEKIKPYVTRDTQICQNSITKLKTKLAEEGIQIKRLYTINQIAINYLINQIRKQPNNNSFFWNQKKGETRRTLRPKEIHAAYRGGRVECWKLGKIKKVNHIDCNSLYPYAACNMRFPDLRTERKNWKPTLDDLQKIGITRCLIYNATNKLGLLPIRTNTGNYFPKNGKYLIGTYTNQELQLAIKEGYKIIKMQWTITYDETDNLIKPIFERLYELRHKQQNEFDSYFYKMMMNSCLGKLAQTRTGQEYEIDSVEKAHEYLKAKYEIVKGIGLNYMYRKNTNERPKKYYTPIIPTLVNAYARCYMYQQYKKIPLKNLIYTDTDSIMFTDNYIGEFKISQKMGEFKIEHINQTMLIYGRKTYAIGQNIRASGIHTKNLTMDHFKEGKIENKKMITIQTTNDINQAGKFQTETRDLNTQLQEHQKVIQLYEAEKLLIDADIEDITYFQKDIESIN